VGVLQVGEFARKKPVDEDVNKKLRNIHYWKPLLGITGKDMEDYN
jgi:hypothetical protein